MLWTVFVILLVLWPLGFSFHIAGSLIHLLLVVALVVLVVDLLTGRSAAVVKQHSDPSLKPGAPHPSDCELPTFVPLTPLECNFSIF